MWPWDHVAVAYLLVSALSRGVRDHPPTRLAGVVAAGAALLPDLIDKPLAWWLAVLPSGRSLGHSLLVALPISAIVLLVGVVLGRRFLSVAFVVGYLSHLAGDVAYPLVVKGDLRVEFLLWPVIPADPGGSGGGLPHLADLVTEFLAFLATPSGALYAVGDAALLGLAVVVWVRDRRALSTAGTTTRE